MSIPARSPGQSSPRTSMSQPAQMEEEYIESNNTSFDPYHAQGRTADSKSSKRTTNGLLAIIACLLFVMKFKW